jgi:hypothetical protein
LTRLTRAELLNDLIEQVTFYLDRLESRQDPGSVHAAIHLDSTGPRKLHVTVESIQTLPRQ